MRCRDPDLVAAVVAVGDALHEALADLQAASTGDGAAARELARDAAGWAGAGPAELLSRLDHLVDGFTAVRAEVLVAERESGTWRSSGAGDRSFEAWRARTSRAGERAAAAQVRQADGLAAVPAAAAAVTEGRIGLEHAAVIGRARRHRHPRPAAGRPVRGGSGSS